MTDITKVTKPKALNFMAYSNMMPHFTVRFRGTRSEFAEGLAGPTHMTISAVSFLVARSPVFKEASSSC